MSLLGFAGFPSVRSLTIRVAAGLVVLVFSACAAEARAAPRLEAPRDGVVVSKTFRFAVVRADHVKRVAFLVDARVTDVDVVAPFQYGRRGRVDAGRLAPGLHRLAARVTDRTGRVTTLRRRIRVPRVAAVESTGGQSFYVDCTGGSNADSGTTMTSAWQSLSAVNNATFEPGDTIHFKRGCAWNRGLLLESSGMEGDPITYTAYGEGRAPIIRNTRDGTYGTGVMVAGDFNIIEHLLVRDVGESGVLMRRGADHNIVRNVEVTAAGLGIVAYGRDNLITRSFVHDLTMVVDSAEPDDDYGAVCFWVAAPDNEISYNRGVRCRAPSHDYGSDGGFVEIWRQGDNTLVHHNLADSTDGFLEIGGAGSATNVTVARNVLFNVRGGMCLHNTGSIGIWVDGLRFEHNTYFSTAGGYRVLDCVRGLTPSMVVMRNNIFHGDVQIAGSGTFTHTDNLYFMTGGASVGYALDSTEKVGDPLFVDPFNQDFRLQPGSPAIDAGVWSEIDGAEPVVGQAPDLGALEYGSASPLTQLPLPSAE
jgi:hypothetical protein